MTVTVYNPITGEPSRYEMPAGGRGYTRAPSLISLWSTAPYLLNNTVGPFDPSPSVEARMKVVRRAASSRCCGRRSAPRTRCSGDKVPGIIDRTTARSYVTIPIGFQPELLVNAAGAVPRLPAARQRAAATS